MKLTQAEAARAAGVSRTHILRAIKGGKLSAEKLDDGSVRIDGSELLRVWPNADLARARNSGKALLQKLMVSGLKPVSDYFPISLRHQGRRAWFNSARYSRCSRSICSARAAVRPCSLSNASRH